LNGSGLDELKGLGERGFIALPKLYVVGGCGSGVEADCLADYESNGLGFRLANGVGGLSPACILVEQLMRDLVGQYAGGFSG